MIKKIFTTAFVFALMSCTIAAAEVSNEAKLYYNQGVDTYRNGQFDQAVDLFKKAISIDSNYIDAYYNLGIILQQMNENAEALNVFKQIIVRQPNDYEAVYNAAVLSAKLGQDTNAKRYLAIIPRNSELYSKAEAMAASMNTNLDAIAKELQELAAANMPKIPQTNGTYANIPSPTGITTDSKGNLYVASFSSNSITKITPSGARSDFVKTNLNGPIDITSDSSDNIYVANYNANNVVKITPAGGVITFLSNIQKPYCLHVDGDMIFISSQGSNTVLRQKL